MNPFHYGIDKLTLETVFALLRGQRPGVIEPAAAQVQASRQRVTAILASGRAVYGINTGFGPLCETRISSAQANRLQENLLLTHAVGVGAPISPELSKLMLICKLHALCQGYSGVRWAVVERIHYFIRHDLLPVVPEQGSVGASGDLAPLSHLFLPLLGEGAFWVENEAVPARELLAQHDLAPLALQAKEGLALINGTQFILVHAVVGLERLAYLLDLADLAGAMSLEGFQGSAAPFQAGLHRLRPFAGAVKVATRIRALLAGSENLHAHQDCPRVQDPYSLRCMPQVHGASRHAWDHLRALTETELNAVTDNPVVLSETEVISGGNFHGQPLALPLDYAALAAAELGNISDRRCYLLLAGKYGLPPMLTAEGGLNSGYMIPQYTTAALVSENKSLCFPASADSIPTAMGQEDHVSMGSISGRKFNQMLGNVEKILAIELMYAAQALEFRRPLRCGPLIEQAHARIRQQVPKLEADRLLMDDLQAMIGLVQQRAFAVEDAALGLAAGELVGA